MGLLGSIGSFLFGGSKKTNEQTSSGTQTRSPYAPTIPYINDFLNDATVMYNGGSPYFSQTEGTGYGLLDKMVADGPSAQYKAADKTLTDTASGQYLTPDTNPYLADIAKRVSGIAGATTNATFGGRGRANSGLAGYYAGKAVGDSLTDMYGSVYENERGRQQTASMDAPDFEKSRYDAPQALISAGQNISSRPFDITDRYGSLLTNIAQLGGTTEQTGKVTNYQKSPGLFGNIVNSFTNKLFPGGGSGPW